MAERNPRDTPAGTAAATARAEANVFSSEPRSFKMDRRSPEASALRDAVSRKLLEFLGSYSDDVLTEYIIVLVCNGKHQNQARDDLEAFLGNESEKFVAWLWDYLSDQINVSKPQLDSLDMKTKSMGNICDPSSYNRNFGSTNEIEDSERCKDCCPSYSPSVDVHTDVPQEQACAAYDKIAESNSSALPCQPLHVPETEQVAKNSQPIIREDIKPKYLSIRSDVPRRFSANNVDVEEAQIARPRGNVWDRLGKPCKDNESILGVEKHHIVKREKINNNVEELQDPRPMLVKPYARLISDETEKVAVLDKGNGKIISNNHPGGYDIKEDVTQGSLDQLVRSKRKRHYSGTTCGNTSASLSGGEENFLQDKDTFHRTKGSLPVKHQCLPRSNELATNAKRTTGMFPEPALSSLRSLSEHKAHADKVVQSLLKENTSPTTSMQNAVPIGSSALYKSKSIKYASENSETRPVQNEILDLKLKLHQVEKDMHMLRSKQANLNHSKPVPSSGLQNSLKEDAESRTVFVTNVHFAASREALLSHFMKCGSIVKVTMLTDTTTGQPKGEAYIVFVNKWSVDKAISLSGTSFFSRTLTVMRKADMSPGSLTPTPPSTKLPQPRYPELFKKVPVQRHYTKSHLQWRRDESVTDTSVPVPTNKLQSSSAAK
ncbi:zinc finger CCCH-type containing 14 [Musa troglodytarum]|uniref:Zinc finger CCCH-type containing 14 n=1 Tax=Musa troglodytarum TaxID=320322 RepID=A0A9E7FG95_9LILI|nr:zinc finger CCCH-type containing 14 [Musa troglodytarum]